MRDSNTFTNFQALPPMQHTIVLKILWQSIANCRYEKTTGKKMHSYLALKEKTGKKNNGSLKPLIPDGKGNLWPLQHLWSIFWISTVDPLRLLSLLGGFSLTNHVPW
jgi:hypothetical protein